MSRAFNTALYDADVCLNQLEAVLTQGLGGRSRDGITKTLYTAAMSFCCANDIESNNQARGRSGKYFEYLVGNVMATALGVRGAARIEALNPELARGLNPDHLFEIGDGGALIHLAVKISTRERIVQPWAHQRILDGAYGTDRIKGVMVFLHETNRLKTGIQETCTPARLRQYQMFVAKILHRGGKYVGIPSRGRSGPRESDCQLQLALHRLEALVHLAGETVLRGQ